MVGSACTGHTSTPPNPSWLNQPIRGLQRQVTNKLARKAHLLGGSTPSEVSVSLMLRQATDMRVPARPSVLGSKAVSDYGPAVARALLASAQCACGCVAVRECYPRVYTSLLHVLSRFLVTCATRGVSEGMSDMKTLSASLRGHSLAMIADRKALRGGRLPPGGGKGLLTVQGDKPCGRWILSPMCMSIKRLRVYYMQLSRFNRALPEPRQVEINEALNGHTAVLTTPFSCSKRDLTSFYRFCLRAGTLSRKLSVGPGIPSTSACLEQAGGSKGGNAAYVRSSLSEMQAMNVTHHELMKFTEGVPQALFGEYRVLDMVPEYTGSLPVTTYLFPWDKSYEIDSLEWTILRGRLLSLFWAWASTSWEHVPGCRQVCLAERGWKTRVVTPCDAGLMYLGSYLNATGLSLLKRRGTHPSLRTEKGRSVAASIDWTVGTRSGRVRSADLKSASDLLPMDLMLQGFNGLADGLDMTDCMRKVGLRMLGPYFMWEQRRPSDLVDSGVLTARGALMGSPITWPMLSLYLEWLHSECGSKGWYAVVGDDYAGSLTRHENARFNRILKRTGGIPSFGKDYYFNEGYGVLCEELVHVPTGSIDATISVRAISGVQKAGSMTPAWSIGPSLVDRLDAWGHPAGSAICSYWFAKEISSWRKLGVDPYGPLGAGGAGFPGYPSTDTMKRIRTLMAHYSGKGREVRDRYTRNVRAAWASRAGGRDSSLDGEDLAAAIRDHWERLKDEFVKTSQGIPPPSVNRHTRFLLDDNGSTALEPDWEPEGGAESRFFGNRFAILRIAGLLPTEKGRALNSQGYIAEQLRLCNDRIRVRGHGFWSEDLVDRAGLLDSFICTENYELVPRGLPRFRDNLHTYETD